jgi:hypothetical protein
MWRFYYMHVQVTVKGGAENLIQATGTNEWKTWSMVVLRSVNWCTQKWTEQMKQECIPVQKLVPKSFRHESTNCALSRSHHS